MAAITHVRALLRRLPPGYRQETAAAGWQDHVEAPRLTVIIIMPIRALTEVAATVVPKVCVPGAGRSTAHLRVAVLLCRHQVIRRRQEAEGLILRLPEIHIRRHQGATIRLLEATVNRREAIALLPGAIAHLRLPQEATARLPAAVAEVACVRPEAAAVAPDNTGI